MPNIFSQKLGDTPQEAFNKTLCFAIFTFGLMGAARGLDEGLISGTVAQKSFISEYGLKDPSLSKSQQASRLGNITAMVQIGSVLGALIAFILSDRIGRIWATRQLCLIWIIGVAIFVTANGSIGQVYAGRFIMGCGIGQTTVVAPTYLAEIAPRSIRGLCVTAFSGFVYLGIMLGYFTSWGSSLHISDESARQWIIPTSLHIVFAGLIIILSFFVEESPRYLAKVGRLDLATINMATIRHLPKEHLYITTEMKDISDQLEREKEAIHGSGFFSSLKELFFLRSNRYRFMLGIMSQLLGQWSGANSITIYAPEFFAMLGTTGQSEKLFATAIFGVVKFVSAIICSLFLIDFLGRKHALSLGIILQCTAMLYIAVYLTVVPEIQEKNAHIQSQSARNAGTGAIAMIYISGVGWALGWNSIQYLINAEIFPLRVRSLGSSIVMSFHFVNQYGNSKAVPQMLLQTTLKPQGTFWFFSAIILLGLAWVWFFLPETAGKPLEAMDDMFALPWYIIGRKGAKITAGDGSVAEAYARGDLEKIEAVGIHVENTTETGEKSMG